MKQLIALEMDKAEPEHAMIYNHHIVCVVGWCLNLTLLHKNNLHKGVMLYQEFTISSNYSIIY